jgi:hypothetical protein
MLSLLNATVREIEAGALLAYKQRVQGQFLRGPIPLDTLATASGLPGQALAVLLLIHYRVAVTRSDWVTLPKGLLERFGVSRDSKARALHALEKSSLIAVERGCGRAARVTLSKEPKHGN